MRDILCFRFLELFRFYVDCVTESKAADNPISVDTKEAIAASKEADKICQEVSTLINAAAFPKDVTDKVITGVDVLGTADQELSLVLAALETAGLADRTKSFLISDATPADPNACTVWKHGRRSRRSDPNSRLPPRSPGIRQRCDGFVLQCFVSTVFVTV